MRSKHLVRTAVGIAGLIVLGMAPFIAYIGLRSSTAQVQTTWPSGVALIVSNGTTLSSLAVLEPSSPPVIVTFPVHSVLDAPSSGRLRALSMFRVGGADLVARALAETLGVPIAHWAVWSGQIGSITTAKTNLGAHTNAVGSLVGQPARNDVPTVDAPGRTEYLDNLPYYQLDIAAVVGVLRSRTPISPSPTPVAPTISAAPSPSPSSLLQFSTTSITVINQGAAQGEATRTADELRRAGYTNVTIGTTAKKSIQGTHIYYRLGGRPAADEIAGQISGASVESLPNGYGTTAEIVIAIGGSGRSTSGGTRTKTTPRPTPSESVIVTP